MKIWIFQNIYCQNEFDLAAQRKNVHSLISNYNWDGVREAIRSARDKRH